MSILRSLFGTHTPSAEESPADSNADEQATAEERRTRERINARPGTKVLIIDDSPTIVAALGKILESVHYTYCEALDAESGIEMARSQQPELIFLDIVLPGMNGFAALRQMRRDPQLKHIPIIMISGNEQATEQFYANRIGADDFMKKPFSRPEVFAKIEPLLDAESIPRRKGLVAEEATPASPAPLVLTTQQSAPTNNAASTAPVSPACSAVEEAPQTSASDIAPIELPPLQARKELTAMGLQYFDQGQFFAAIQRGDRLAFELFIAGGGIDLAGESEGKTALQIARENGRTQIFALLRSRLASAAA